MAFFRAWVYKNIEFLAASQSWVVTTYSAYSYIHHHRAPWEQTPPWSFLISMNCALILKEHSKNFVSYSNICFQISFNLFLSPFSILKYSCKPKSCTYTDTLTSTFLNRFLPSWVLSPELLKTIYKRPLFSPKSIIVGNFLLCSCITKVICTCAVSGLFGHSWQLIWWSLHSRDSLILWVWDFGLYQGMMKVVQYPVSDTGPTVRCSRDWVLLHLEKCNKDIGDHSQCLVSHFISNCIDTCKCVYVLS